MLVQADNGTLEATEAVAACAGGQTGEDTTAVTVTDGTMTIVLGDAGHLSSQNMSTGTVAGGGVSHDGSGEDAGIGAMVDGFHGVSLGYKINDAMSATVAYQASGDVLTCMGHKKPLTVKQVLPTVKVDSVLVFLEPLVQQQSVLLKPVLLLLMPQELLPMMILELRVPQWD